MPDNRQQKSPPPSQGIFDDPELLNFSSGKSEAGSDSSTWGNWGSSLLDTVKRGYDWVTTPQQEDPDPYAVAKLGYSPTGPSGRQVSPAQAAGETIAAAIPYMAAPAEGTSLLARVAGAGLTRGMGALGGYELGKRATGSPLGGAAGAVGGAMLPEAVKYSGLGRLISRVLPKAAQVGEAEAAEAGQYRPSEKAASLSAKARDYGPEFNAQQWQEEINRNQSIIRNPKATPEEVRIATERLRDAQQAAGGERRIITPGQQARETGMWGAAVGKAAPNPSIWTPENVRLIDAIKKRYGGT